MDLAIEDLVGAWRLTSYAVVAEDGGRRFPLGEDAKGLLLYTPDGYMSAQIMASGRAPGGKELHFSSLDQAALAARGYVAYSGPFRLDPSTGALSHEMQVSLFSGWIDQVQVRLANLEAGVLTLQTSGPVAIAGKIEHPRLTWRRVNG
jgi:hypothetical protein